jgi:hypothetical protein
LVITNPYLPGLFFFDLRNTMQQHEAMARPPTMAAMITATTFLSVRRSDECRSERVTGEKDSRSCRNPNLRFE